MYKMVIITQENNGSISIETTYSNNATNNFVLTDLQEQAEFIGSFYNEIQNNVFAGSDTIYKIIDFFLIKRYFDSSGSNYNGEPIYNQSYDASTNIMMREIFINKTFSLEDFVIMVYEKANDSTDPEYNVFVELKTYVDLLLTYISSTNRIIALNLSSASTVIVSQNNSSTYAFYDFLLNEINYLIDITENTFNTLREDNPDIDITVNLQQITGIERLYSILNFLSLIPNLISDKQALIDEIDALEKRLDKVVGETLTTTSVIQLNLEAETDIDFIYAIYVRVFGVPQNGVFDAEKINFLRYLSNNELYDLLQSVTG